jgi:hypothetical protein
MVLLIKTGYYKAVSHFGISLAQLERAVGRNLMKMAGIRSKE